MFSGRSMVALVSRPLASCPASLMHPTQHFNTHVLILGNGPAGISLSAFLSGITPFYNGLQPHPNAQLHKCLLETQQSLIEQDLTWIENVEQLADAGRPLAVLYDTLARPGADVGETNPSCLRWEKRRDQTADHLVLGETPIGGSWNDYDPEMVAVSFSSWLDLPGYSVKQYLDVAPHVSRLPSVVIAAYMENYTKRLGIRKNFRPHTKVQSIKKVGDVWHSTGEYCDGRSFTVTSNLVVLACGKTRPRILEISNEEKCQRIIYDVLSLKTRILQEIENTDACSSGQGNRIIVVGDGISSADAVRHCLEKGITVLHVMRRNDRQLRSILMSRLSSTYYPEYTALYRLMTGKDQHPLYQKYCGSVVTAVNDKFVTISTPKGEMKESFTLMTVCIGREADVQNLFEGKLDLNGYESESDSSLFAVGALAGDHFVRYLIGGCLHVARCVLKK